MRLMRGLFVLAIVAALWGAPLSVSAAVNELSSPQVSPGSGFVTTVFTFRVRYEGGFPAVAVGVTVAGSTVPMVLETGSTTAGWWAGSTALPSGAWSTSFRATTDRGPTPTAAGPIVIVAGLTSPSPTLSAVAATGSEVTPESVPANGIDGPAAPPAAPAPSPDAAPASATAEATEAPAAPGPNPGPGSDGSDAPSESVSGSTSAPGGGGQDAAAAHGAPAASPPSTSAPGGDLAVVQPASDTEPRDGSASAEEMVADVLLAGLAGVASVTIVGLLLLIAGRRRELARATASPGPAVADDAPARRIARAGRAQPSDDPIVAALGVDDEMAARRAIRRAGRAPEGGRAGTVPKGR